MVNNASTTAPRPMNIALGAFRLPSIRRHPWRQRQFVMNRPSMIRQHLLGIIDLAVIHDATQKVGLPSEEKTREHPGKRRRGPPRHVFAVEHPLGAQELAIERRKWQLCGQNGMLNIE